MKKAIPLTPDQQMELLKKFEQRADSQGFKKNGRNVSKQRKDAQREFLIGAMTMMDIVQGNVEETCIPPGWYFQMLRGEYVEAIRPHVTVQL